MRMRRVGNLNLVKLITRLTTSNIVFFTITPRRFTTITASSRTLKFMLLPAGNSHLPHSHHLTRISLARTNTKGMLGSREGLLIISRGNLFRRINIRICRRIPLRRNHTTIFTIITGTTITVTNNNRCLLRPRRTPRLTLITPR